MLKDAAVQESDKVATLHAVDVVLGLSLQSGTSTQVVTHSADTFVVTEEMAALLETRKQARADKNWKESDRIRDELKAKGFLVVDVADGQQLTPLS
jgi:cysteinyl-tRNA synthetase